jgi:hypothetical protein
MEVTKGLFESRLIRGSTFQKPKLYQKLPQKREACLKEVSPGAFSFVAEKKNSFAANMNRSDLLPWPSFVPAAFLRILLYRCQLRRAPGLAPLLTDLGVPFPNGRRKFQFIFHF